MIMNLTACAHRVDSAGNHYYYPPFLPGTGPGPLDCNAKYDCPDAGKYTGGGFGSGVSINQVTVNGRGYQIVRSK